MLIMISVSQKTISLMKCWVSMFHVQSLKNELNLTMTKNHQKQTSVETYQIMTRPFVSQVVLVRERILPIAI
ncbi:hypothetical protein UN88_03935 [Escherichia coli]|nr:hypothetical protein UN88_03935 [Escherichia coli]